MNIPKIEIDSHNLEDWVATAVDCRNLVFQALDLTPYDGRLAALPQADEPENNCLFLGCTLGPGLAAAALSHHALIFPDLRQRPYKPYRPSLYSPEELFDRFDPMRPESYRECADWLIYTSYMEVGTDHRPLKPPKYVDAGPDEVLARRLHDHFIEDETDEFLNQFAPPHGSGVVAIMGGHDVERGACAYREIANLARELARSGFLVVSGGGPGLMEASNLGAYFGAQEDPSTLNGAIDKLSKAPLYSHADWLKLAWEIKAEYPSLDLKKSRSLGVPTWFYGFEPPNIFATHIAKYFENSLREEGLLAMASHGVVFAEGNAGTVQEIFQDGCQNYYESYGFKSPMILLDSGYWNPKPDKQGNYSDRKKPVWPLLRKLAQEKGFAELLELTDDTVTILKRIQSFRP